MTQGYNGKKEAKYWALHNLKGLVATIPTPFTEDLEVDYEAVRELTRHCVNIGSDALFAVGNVGEFFSLTMEERKKVCETVVYEVKGRIPVIIQTASHCAKDCVELTKHAQEVGADLAAILVPYFQTKSEQSVYEFFKYVSERVDIGIVLYNSPLAAKLSPKAISEIALKIDNICAVKDGMTDLLNALEIYRLSQGKVVVSDPLEDHWIHAVTMFKPPVLLCNWVVYLFQRLDLRPLRQYTDLAMNGEMDKAVEIYYKLSPLRKLMNKVFTETYWRGVYPIAHFKYWCELLGLPGGPVRPPVLQITPGEKEWLRAELEATGIIKAKV